VRVAQVLKEAGINVDVKCSDASAACALLESEGRMTPLSDWGIPGTYVFDNTRSRIGYELNKLCYSLTDAKNRELYRRDEEAYLARYKLSDGQKSAIRRRDWLALTKHCGGNIYYVYKLGATVGQGLYHMGAQMRGLSYEEFLATRNARGAR
jgi:protocatechuate 4,5-dioxygenase alpha chain